MSFQPAKRPRRSARLAGPSTELPACPIVDLPLELMEAIISNLGYADLYSLASTSKLFYTTYHLRAVLMKLEQYSLCVDARDSSWNGELFCLSDAQSGTFGWTPFYFVLGLSGEPLDVDGDDQYLSVEADTPEFERFDDAAPTGAYLFIQQIKSAVWLRPDIADNQNNDVSIRDIETLDWNSDLAGRLVRATPALLKSRFKCPECEGTGEITLGCDSVSKRWPLLSTTFMYDIPCPRCEITCEFAVEIMNEMDESIEADYDGHSGCSCCG